MLQEKYKTGELNKKKKLTDIGFFGFSGFGRLFFRSILDRLILTINQLLIQKYGL